jgi:hypothetical protein
MTLPKAERLRLMLAASLRRSPVAPVRPWRSEPARSTRCSRPRRTAPAPACPGPIAIASRDIVRTAWLRELAAFILVAAAALRRSPCSTSRVQSRTFLTVTSRSPPATYVPRTGSSCPSTPATFSAHLDLGRALWLLVKGSWPSGLSVFAPPRIRTPRQFPSLPTFPSFPASCRAIYPNFSYLSFIIFGRSTMLQCEINVHYGQLPRLLEFYLN